MTDLTRELIYGLSTISFILTGAVMGLLFFLYLRAYIKQHRTKPILALVWLFGSATFAYALITALYIFKVFNTSFESWMIVANMAIAIAGINLTTISFGD